MTLSILFTKTQMFVLHFTAAPPLNIPTTKMQITMEYQTFSNQNQQMKAVHFFFLKFIGLVLPKTSNDDEFHQSANILNRLE